MEILFLPINRYGSEMYYRSGEVLLEGGRRRKEDGGWKMDGGCRMEVDG
jgi:hypothetical protein